MFSYRCIPSLVLHKWKDTEVFPAVWVSKRVQTPMVFPLLKCKELLHEITKGLLVLLFFGLRLHIIVYPEHRKYLPQQQPHLHSECLNGAVMGQSRAYSQCLQCLHSTLRGPLSSVRITPHDKHADSTVRTSFIL